MVDIVVVVVEQVGWWKSKSFVSIIDFFFPNFKSEAAFEDSSFWWLLLNHIRDYNVYI